MMSPQLKKWHSSLLNNYNLYLFDCDGVLWHDDTVLKGSKELLNYLFTQNKKVIFVTNNSSKSRAEYLEKFKELGFSLPLTEDNIICSSYTVAHYLSHLSTDEFDKTTQKVFSVGGSGIAFELKKVGIQCLESRKLFGDKLLKKEELIHYQLDPTIGAVVVGIDDHFTYTKAAVATALLTQHKIRNQFSQFNQQKKPVLFISTNQDSTLPTANHTLPGGGSVVAMISTASHRKPINVGKPESLMLEIVLENLKIEKSKCLMIGDRLDTDILFGINGGIDTLIVTETGINSCEDVLNKENEIHPTYMIEDISKILSTT